MSGLTESTEALVNTLEKQYGELQMYVVMFYQPDNKYVTMCRCWEELSVLVRVQVHNTSLLFEQRQRNSIADDGHTRNIQCHGLIST